MARLEFNRKTRRAIIERANGKCEACSAALKIGEGEVDHVLPDALGGKPEASNGEFLCRICHAAKTAGDVRRIRKADRQRDRQTRAIVPVVKMPARQSPISARTAKNQAREKLPPPPRRSLFEAVR